MKAQRQAELRGIHPLCRAQSLPLCAATGLSPTRNVHLCRPGGEAHNFVTGLLAPGKPTTTSSV